jgi:sulfate adenylyltransferase subunit 2
MSRALSHLDVLESESIHILREVAGELERPAILFSGGKDSIVMLRIAEKAFAPMSLPMPLVHVDTGHNFPEVIAFRDARAAELRATLVVRELEAFLRDGRIRERPGEDGSRNRLQIPVLLATIKELRFDALLGGARRDEEKARAKERVFSFRDAHGQWDPKNQRPELWSLYNTRRHAGEHLRVFPISNWTELDVWQYIAREKLALPSIYFAHEREVVERGGQWMPVSHLLPAQPNEAVVRKSVRFRTVGDMTCTGCVASHAANAEDVIAETMAARVTERGSRADDRVSEAAMEDRKREGYF